MALQDAHQLCFSYAFVFKLGAKQARGTDGKDL